MTSDYKSKNTKPAIDNISTLFAGQGLTPLLNIKYTDAENHDITNVESYFRPLAATTSAYYLYLATTTATGTTSIYTTLNGFPFESSKSFELYTRVKDIAGDWSAYATSTYNTLSSEATSTTKFYCKSVPNSKLGSVECPNPDLIIEFTPNYFADVTYSSIPGNTAIQSVSVQIATSSTNFASTTIANLSISTTSLASTSLGQWGSFANLLNSNSFALKANTKYYYKVTVNSRWVVAAPTYESPVIRSSDVMSFTTGNFNIFQNSNYSYDNLSRIKQVLKDEDASYENTIYNYDDLSRLISVNQNSNRYATSTLTVESYVYSPTGKIFNNGGRSYTYGSSLLHIPTQIGSDILAWDLRGRLATNTVVNNNISINNILSWNDLNRLKSKSSNATTTNYYYDTEGNRVLSFTLKSISTSTLITVGTTTVSVPTTTYNIVNKLYTPTQNIQNTGTTTSYAINLGDKPILNIDRITIPATTTQRSVSLQIGIRNSSSSEFTSTASIPVLDTSTTTNMGNILPYIGKKGTSKYQRLYFNGLKPGATQYITIYFATSSATQAIPVIFTGATPKGTITAGSSFIPTTGSSTTISFIPIASSTTIQIGSTSYTSDNYAYIDDYYLYLTKSSTTSTTTSTYIQSLITNHLNSIEKVLDYNTGTVLSTSTYSTYGSLTKIGNTNSNRGYTNHQQDQSDFIYMNDRYQYPNYGVFISPDVITQTSGPNSQSYLSNPQNLNAYSYALDNPVMYVDRDGKSPVDAMNGFSNAYISNLSLGLGRVDTNYYTGDSKNDYSIGQSIGDIAGLISGVAETAFGGSTVGGASLVVVAGTVTGPGELVIAPAGIAIATQGALITTHGVGVTGVSGYNLSKSGSDYSNVKSGSSGGESAGKKFSNSTKQKSYDEAGGKCVFCDKKTTKENGPLKTNTDHAIAKSLGGNNTLNNAQNTCRTCNLQKGIKDSFAFLRAKISK